MTKQFIQNVLTELGESMDTWTMLKDKVAQIGLIGDRFIYLDPAHVMVYFSSDGSLYVKHLLGNIREFSGTNIPENCVAFTLNGKTYIITESPFGIETSLGKVHTIIDFDNISGFYRKYDSVEYYLK